MLSGIALRYLIDGYNVIHALPSLQAIAAVDIESARDTLIEMAAALLEPGLEIVLVFDGRGPVTESGPALQGIIGLTTVYTAQNLSADSWIERTVHKSKLRHLCTVITADGGIRDLCRGLGARVFTPEWLEAEMGRHRSRTAGGLGRRSAARAPGDHFDPASRERLSRLRDELDDPDRES